MKKRTLLAIAAACFGTGCGGSDSGSGPAANTHGAFIDACSLLTQAEVEVIMGQPVLATKKDTSSGYITVCSYTGKVDSVHLAILPAKFQVLAWTNAGIAAHQGSAVVTAQSFIANQRTLLAAGHWETVTGVGTDAIYVNTTGKIQMYKGDVEADVVYMPLGRPDTTAAVKSAEVAAGIKVGEKL